MIIIFIVMLFRPQILASKSKTWVKFQAKWGPKYLRKIMSKETDFKACLSEGSESIYWQASEIRGNFSNHMNQLHPQIQTYRCMWDIDQIGQSRDKVINMKLRKLKK